MAIQPVDKDYLVLHFAEFSVEEESRVTALNDTALLFVDEGVFGTKARYALALMIAHMLKLSQLQGSGAADSVSVGNVSEHYSTPQIKSSMGLTTYGQMFETIAKQKSVCSRSLFI
jgi:hypothetical protein